MDIHTYYRLYPELRKRAWQRCYAATELLRIFVARANSEPSKICGLDLPAGSLFILPSELYESIGMHPLVYDDAMRRLIDEGDITVTEYHFNRIITLTHYPTPNRLTGNDVGAQYIAPAQAEQTSPTSNHLTGNEVGAQYIAPAQAEQTSPAPNLLTGNEVGAQYIAPAPPEHPDNHTFASAKSLHLKSHPLKPKNNIRAGPYLVHA